MIKFTTLICLLYLILSCQNKDAYDGHWHLIIPPDNISNIEILVDENNRHTVEYIVLDLKNGEGLWNKKRELSRNLNTQLLDANTKLLVTVADHHLLEYEVEFVNRNLLLKSTSGEIRYIGYLCGEGCCDKQKDYFSDIKQDIDLPIMTDTTKSKANPIKQSLHMKVHLGNLKEFYYNGHSPHPRLSYYKRPLLVRDIPEAIDRFRIKVPENYRSKIFYSIEADKDVSIEQLIEVVAAFKKHGVKKLNLAVRADTNLHKSFKHRYLPFSFADLEPLSEKSSVKDFVNELSSL